MSNTYALQRPSSEQLVDLHVYLLPREVWNEKYRSSFNESISEALSAGFVRVWPELTVNGLRMVIEEELGHDILPFNYVFLRSVGRCMTQIKPKQELELKCKAFLPPAAWSPEIVVLETSEQDGVLAFQSYDATHPTNHDRTVPMEGMPPPHPQHTSSLPWEPSTGVHHPHHTSQEPTPISHDSNTTAHGSAPSGHRTSPHEPTLNLKAWGSPLHPSSSSIPISGPGGHDINPSLLTNQSHLHQSINDYHNPHIKPDSKADNHYYHRNNPNEPDLSTAPNNSSSPRTVHPSVTTRPPIHKQDWNPKFGGFTNADPKSHSTYYTNTNQSNHTTDVADSNDWDNHNQNTYPSSKNIHQRNQHPHHHPNPYQTAPLKRTPSDSSSVPYSATPPDIPTSDDTPPPGPSHPMQQHAVRPGQDPYGPMTAGAIPPIAKPGRPDAYSNNTNEDSGISEEFDPELDRRNPGFDNHYNQLPRNHPNHPQHGQFRIRSDEYQGASRDEEMQRQSEQSIRDEYEAEVRRREEEEERIAEEERREQVYADDGRKTRERSIKEEKERRRKQERKRMEEEHQNEAKQELEEERQKKNEHRRHTEKEREIAFGDKSDTDAVDMEMGHGDDYDDDQNWTDSQLRSRAEHELKDYEPLSTLQQDLVHSRGGPLDESVHSRGGQTRVGRSRSSNTPSRQRRLPSDKDDERSSEDAVQEAVQDGLKRVHLTPEIHRKAKIGKVKDTSTTDEEEEMYEVDPKIADLLDELQAARQERLDKEKEREALIKKAKNLQTKTIDRRNKGQHEGDPKVNRRKLQNEARDYWKKRYFDEKKRTVPIEEEGARVRHQLEVLHRKLMSHLEGKKGKGPAVKGPPSKKNDHKMMIVKLQHEVDEIKRQVDNAKMKLTSEVKLRNQAEEEVRGLKAEVTQRKINLTLTRNQKLAAVKKGEAMLFSKTSNPTSHGNGPMPSSAKTF